MITPHQQRCYITDNPNQKYLITEDDLRDLLEYRLRVNSHIDVWNWIIFVKKHRKQQLRTRTQEQP